MIMLQLDAFALQLPLKAYLQFSPIWFLTSSKQL